MQTIIPAILENNFKDILFEIEKYKNLVNKIQIDLVNYNLIDSEELPYLDKIDYEFDLLKESNFDILEKVKNIGASAIVIHLNQNIILKDIKSFCDEYNIKIGICGKVEDILNNLIYADYIQLMGIEKIGYQGQAFRESVLDDIKRLRANTNKIIQIDGAMNDKTILNCKKTGADRFVVGSFLKYSENVEYDYKKLQNILNS